MNLNHPFKLHPKFPENISRIFPLLLFLLNSIHSVEQLKYEHLKTITTDRVIVNSINIIEVMVLLASLSLCNAISPLRFSEQSKSFHPIVFPVSGFLNLRLFALRNGLERRNLSRNTNRLRVFAVTEGSDNRNSSKSKEVEDEDEGDPSVPSWAKPGSDEPPPWARDEAQKESSSFEFPFYVYLLASTIAAIAAIGSVFEYANQRPVFGVVNSDSVLYTPLLGFFAFTGIPTSAFLWFKSVEVANKEAEEQDRRDGYL